MLANKFKNGKNLDFDKLLKDYLIKHYGNILNFTQL